MISLLTRYNSYIGREYADRMIRAEVEFKVLTFGNYPPREEVEDRRCAGYWKPISMLAIESSRLVERFNSTTDPAFLAYLKNNVPGVGIQGDVGEIVGKEMLNLFPCGIVNFHPGDLPNYRGCSAPEWQIYEHNPVICTAHYLDEGIDTGDIIEKRKLVLDYRSYHHMRASLYPAISQFVVDFCMKFRKGEKVPVVSQVGGKYRRQMDEQTIETVKTMIDKECL